ncbi:MAG TPA: hypothetical protein VFG55_05010 [Rhodanobacteraceae bacterium]|nr:hypothetical protein [Rhodanobacteraceae bacterium]
MIATDRFVFIHLHKSGGTFVNQCLLRFFPHARRLGYHLPRSRIPASLAELPVLGFVRSPWSYYVSWYAFQSQRPEPNALFRTASEDRTLGFAGTVGNLLRLGTDDALLDRLLPRLPTAYGNRGLNLPGFALEPIRGSGLGFYSYLYRYMVGGGHSNTIIGRMETLRADLLAFLDDLGAPVAPALRDFVMNAAPLNASRHDTWASYYDERSAALVAERDAAVIEPFGYRFQR